MEKKSFIYRNTTIAVLWILILGTIIVEFLPNLLDSLTGGSFYIANGIVTIAIVFWLWRYINVLPGVSRVGYYWKENGMTRLEYGTKSVQLNQVTELFLSDRRLFSMGVNLVICNAGKRMELLSAPLRKNERAEDSEFYTIFMQVLSENKELIQEKDLKGNPIDHWYRAQMPSKKN